MHSNYSSQVIDPRPPASSASAAQLPSTRGSGPVTKGPLCSFRHEHLEEHVSVLCTSGRIEEHCSFGAEPVCQRHSFANTKTQCLLTLVSVPKLLRWTSRTATAYSMKRLLLATGSVRNIIIASLIILVRVELRPVHLLTPASGDSVSILFATIRQPLASFAD